MAALALPVDRISWFERALDGSGISLLPITPQIASIAVDLPEHHRGSTRPTDHCDGNRS